MRHLASFYASGAREQVAQWRTNVISGAVAEGGAREHWRIRIQIRILFRILILF